MSDTTKCARAVGKTTTVTEVVCNKPMGHAGTCAAEPYVSDTTSGTGVVRKYIGKVAWEYADRLGLSLRHERIHSSDIPVLVIREDGRAQAAMTHALEGLGCGPEEAGEIATTFFRLLTGDDPAHVVVSREKDNRVNRAIYRLTKLAGDIDAALEELIDARAGYTSTRLATPSTGEPTE